MQTHSYFYPIKMCLNVSPFKHNYKQNTYISCAGDRGSEETEL